MQKTLFFQSTRIGQFTIDQFPVNQSTLRALSHSTINVEDEFSSDKLKRTSRHCWKKTTVYFTVPILLLSKLHELYTPSHFDAIKTSLRLSRRHYGRQDVITAIMTSLRPSRRHYGLHDIITAVMTSLRPS